MLLCHLLRAFPGTEHILWHTCGETSKTVPNYFGKIQNTFVNFSLLTNVLAGFDMSLDTVLQLSQFRFLISYISVSSIGRSVIAALTEDPKAAAFVLLMKAQTVSIAVVGCSPAVGHKSWKDLVPSSLLGFYLVLVLMVTKK